MKSCPKCGGTFPAGFTVCPQDATPLVHAAELAPGAVLRGKYKILAKLGAGGMGVVYKAQHLLFDEPCALKIVSAHLLQDATFLQRFRSEAVVMRKLNHAHAARVHDFDETDDGLPFIAMEYIEGVGLEQLMAGGEPLDPARAVRIALQVCDALGAAHRLGIVHRDIKPSNILVARAADGSDFAKVLDFGVAKIKPTAAQPGVSLTGTGFVVGTPDYMSPEQAKGLRGDQLDGRSDLYSLGVLLYQLLTGRLPFTGDTPMMVLLAHIQANPPDPRTLRGNLPGPLVDLVLRALQKNPDDRFASAEEMCDALGAVLSILEVDVQGTVNVIGRRSAPAAPPPPAVAEADVPTEHVITPRRTDAAPVQTPPAATQRVTPAHQPPATAPPAAATPEPYELPARRPALQVALLSIVVTALLGVAGMALWNRVRPQQPEVPQQDLPQQQAQKSSPQTAPDAAPVAPRPSPAKSTVPAKNPPSKTSASAAPDKTGEARPVDPAATSPSSTSGAPATNPGPAPADPAPANPDKAGGPEATGPSKPAKPIVVYTGAYAAGRARLNEVEALRAQMRSTPPNQRAALEQQIAEKLQAAINELLRALQEFPAGHAERPAVYASLGEAYRLSGRRGEAISSFQQAATLKPTEARYLLEWGRTLAMGGRLGEAGPVCDRAAGIDAQAGGACWRTVGAEYYIAGRQVEAIAPLQHSVRLSPNEQATWVMLGGALLAGMEFRASGGRVLPRVRVGTEDALRRAVEIAPSTRGGAEARAALEALQTLRTGGIATRFEVETAPSLTTKRNRVRASDAGIMPRATETARPAYPVLARLAHVQGTVTLEIVIGKEGSVMEVEAKSGRPLLYAAAMDAVRRWRYPVQRYRGEPAEVVTSVEVVFRFGEPQP